MAWRCEDHGKISYSDTPCPGASPTGKSLFSHDLRLPSTVQAESSAENRRNLERQSKLKKLVAARQRSERTVARHNHEVAVAVQRHYRKCTSLGLRKRWLDEDAAVASIRTGRKLRTKAHHLTERLALECAPGSHW